MEILSELYLIKPETDEISLRNAGLQSLDVELPLLKQFRELRRLDVSCNKLKTLPIELAEISRLVALDISNNPIESVQHVLPILQRFPSLKSLSFTLNDPSEEKLLLAALPKLRILNAMPLHFPTERRVSPANLTWSDPVLPTEHINNVASILNVLKGVGLVVPPGSEEDQRVSRMFEQQVQLVGMSLKHELQDTKSNEEKQAAEMLLAKSKIVSACTSYATQKAGECAPELGLAWQTLCLLQQDMITGFYNLFQELIQKPFPTSSTPPVDSNQLKQLLEVAEVLELDVQRGVQALAQEKKKVCQLEEENRKLRAEMALKPTSNQSSPPRDIARAPQPVERSNSNLSGFLKDNKGKHHTAPVPPPPAPLISSPPVRNLTLKQLKDLIEAIYASKRKHDQINIETKAPKETMEQHMYTYLNQRFGLHSLIVDYASAIMKGCSKYSTIDCDVATFLHLVRNELDEGYLRLKQKLEDTVVALLRAYLRGLNSRKSEGTITQLVQGKLTSVTLLTREEWQNIVTYMYDTQDSTSILHVIESRLKQTHESGLDYQVFRMILLNYQLHGRLKLLTEFTRQFESVDHEKLGILKRRDFIDLMLNLTPYKTQDEIAQVVQHVDPNDLDCITFSDAVESLFKDIRAIRLKGLKSPSPLIVSSSSPVNSI